MKNNKFIALVAILSQLTGISAKAADTPKVPSDSVKTAESKKSKNPNKQKADTPKISSDSVKTAESKKAKTPSKQKKKKMENRNDVSSEGGYENLYPYGLWGFHEILSLCGGDSWWKYPSYLSVLKNMGTQLKKMEQQADKQEADKIKEKFGQDANVEVIKCKVKKIQEEYKKHFREKRKKTKDLAKFDNDLELEKLKLEMNNLAGEIDKQNVISGVMDAMNVDINNKIIDIENLEKQFNDRYKEDDPEDSYGIYDVVSVGKDVVKNALSKNVKSKFLQKSLNELNKHIDNNELQFFLIFSSASDCNRRLFVSLVCCRNLDFAGNLIKSEAKNVKDPSSSNPFWKMFIAPYVNHNVFLECDTKDLKMNGEEDD